MGPLKDCFNTQIINREDWIPGDKAKLCAMHFTPESYREATGLLTFCYMIQQIEIGKLTLI